MTDDFFPPANDAAIARIDDWRDRSSVLQWLAFSASIDDDGLLYRLSFAEHHIGNPAIRAIHGGVVSSFLQVCALAEIRGRGGPTITAKPVSVHCDFLRPAKGEDLLGRAVVIQRGTRLVFLELTGFQSDAGKPVAKANVAIRLHTDDTA
ncbi:hypothetical protein PB2503_08769 [Parvularcula bermudensis HTCC2503]|uniref:Thioesterase domain-containing protein n=1 Tax=Parvularcula bermudensis (strain ATCC BAA-594 / HTCC2503 / KCTC 12087) TaxID=314260 RepID=E0TC16_PARBH|nr:PaaI family thioesterase [Parvularcula bermudensis]ADM09809.1 hypothetical protein PB2503_08769 [Parvularcula bermudensis HTCC2503]